MPFSRVSEKCEQMASPKHVMVLGSCPMTGVMDLDSYFTIKRVGEVIPVAYGLGLSAQAGKYRPCDSDEDEKEKLVKLLECSRKSESMKIR